jgi:putative ABC transport system permease protein
MLKHYLKADLRNLKRQKLYSIIIIGGLALGLACCFLLLSWARAELSYDSFHQNKAGIFRVVIGSKDGQSAGTCGALAPALKEEIPEILGIARAWTIGEWQMHHGERNLRGNGCFVDPSFLDIFSFPVIEGEKALTLNGPHDLVLTRALAGKIFGPEDPLGKMIVINNRFAKPESFSVVGVIEDVPRNSHIRFDFLFSYQLLKEWYRPGFSDTWSNHSFTAYARIRPDADVSALDGKITDCYNRHLPLNPKTLRLQPLSKIYLHPEIKNHLGPAGNIRYVRLFIAIAFLVLLIACINFANLSTALSTRHVKAIGVRKYVGASRKQIIFQYLAEACVYASAALPVALLIMEMARRPFRMITGTDLMMSAADPTLVAGALVIVLLTGLAAGSYPALYLSSLRPGAIMKGTAKSARTEVLVRRAFIIIQFSLSIVIMAATFVMSRQLDFIHKKDLGYDKENLLYTWTPGLHNEAIRNELMKNPRIVGVGASSSQLDNIGRTQKIGDWSGRGAGEEASINVLDVDYGYLDTYRMKMALGRYYSESHPADQSEAIIVNEAAVRAMKMEAPVGKTMDFSGGHRMIIGVVKDFHFTTLDEEIEPIAFVLYPQQLTCLGIRLKSEGIPASVAYVKSVLARQLPDTVLEFRFLDERLDAMYVAESRSAGLFRAFSVISIFLSCLGLFGLASFMAERRRKEIGIRKTLGATVGKLVLLQLKEIFYLVVVSNVLAWPVAIFYMNAWLRNYAFRVHIGWWVLCLPGVLAALVALATVSYQSIRAANADPKESLRYE